MSDLIKPPFLPPEGHQFRKRYGSRKIHILNAQTNTYQMACGSFISSSSRLPGIYFADQLPSVCSQCCAAVNIKKPRRPRCQSASAQPS